MRRTHVHVHVDIHIQVEHGSQNGYMYSLNYSLHQFTHINMQKNAQHFWQPEVTQLLYCLLTLYKVGRPLSLVMIQHTISTTD